MTLDGDIGSATKNEPEFDFKPINEGLGFHRKVKPLDIEADADDSFSFSVLSSTLGPSVNAKSGMTNDMTPDMAMDPASREQSKGLLSSPTASSAASAAKAKHNAKSVSDLIAALPPSLDFFGESDANSAATSGSTFGASPSATSAKASSGRRSPLFGSPTGIATPGATAAASMATAAPAESSAPRGFLKMPLGRSDYSGKAAAPASIDENVAKTFPSVFPHLGSLAGQPAAATAQVSKNSLSKDTVTRAELASEQNLATGERPVTAHFGSAILDTLVSVGFGCVLLAIALSVTDANLLLLLENTQTDAETVAALLFLFVAGGLIYVLAARSFLGATLGEWSYEIRVGSREMRTRWFYPVLVMWRGALVAASGFILFPIVSMIAGRDVLKFFTGLGLVGIEGGDSIESVDLA